MWQSPRLPEDPLAVSPRLRRSGPEVDGVNRLVLFRTTHLTPDASLAGCLGVWSCLDIVSGLHRIWFARCDHTRDYQGPITLGAQ